MGVGYNGFVKGIRDDDKTIPWENKDKHPARQKLPYGEGHILIYCIVIILYNTMALPINLLVVHAEANAIMHKTCIDMKDCTMYTTLFPCNECAKVIIQAGIKKIYYLMDDKHEKLYMKSSRELLKMAGYQCDHDSRGRSEAPAHSANQK